MTASPPVPVQTLAQLAELKRIFSGIEAALAGCGSGCLLVTSAGRGEGKTSVVAGLAAAAAKQTSQKVLAVDLNWHAPALHAHFGVSPVDGSGLTNGNTACDLVLHSGLDRLDILPALQWQTDSQGPALDENVLGADILRQVKPAYDWVFVDSCSVFPTNRRMMDPVTISKVAHGVVMVVLANVTPRQEVKRARMMLETAGARMVGAIVNQWKNPLS
jgi:Mrp family chromosome partitioning ATPase